jgi:hypothetical protein
MRIVVGAVLAAGIVLQAAAQDGPPPQLFKSYTFNAPLATFSESHGYYDCSEDLGGTARCLNDVEFLGHAFTAGLKFDAQRLMSVSLITEFDENLYFRVAGALGKTFGLCALQGATDRLDLIELARNTKDQAALQSKLSTFESLNLKNGNLTYIYVERPIAELRSKKNAVDAILTAPSGTRTADLLVVVDESSAALIVTFNLPKLALQKIKKSMDAPVENF